MTQRARVIATILLTAGCSPLLLGASLAFAQGKAADTDGANLGGTGGCSAGNQFDASLPKGQTDKQGKPGLIGLGCKDPKTGQLGICDASGACQAVGEKGAPTAQQRADANNGNSADGAGAAAPNGGSGSSGGSSSGGSSGASGAPPQVTPAQPISEPEVLSPSQTAQTAGSTPTSAAPETAQPAQSAQTTLNNLIGQMTPDQTAAQMFMQPGESAAPTQSTDISQPSWLSGAEASLQPSGAPPGLSSGEGTSPAVPTSEPALSTYEPSSLPFTETNPMGSLQDMNSADIQAANANSQLTSGELTAQDAAQAAQNTQNLDAVQNGASTFGQSAADYLNNGSETNGQFPTNSSDGNAYLADQRANLMSPLDPSSPNYDANLRTEVEAVINNEVNPSTYTQQSADAVLERMANASLMHGYTSLSQAINDGFYGPVNTGAVGNMVANGMTPAQTAFADQAISDVTGGSNVCNYCTDQGMSGEIIGPKTDIGGEYFGNLYGSTSWYNQEVQASSDFAASNAVGQTATLPSGLQTVPYAWAGDMSSVASLGSSAPINESALATAPDSPIAWNGQASATVDWTNVAAIYGTPSPTVGEDIASAAEPTGEPTTDQLGNQTEAGIWGDQQQNIVDEQLALEDRQAQAVAETAAYNGALAAQDGLSQTGEAIANATTPSGPEGDQSPALTSSIGPSQADIEQAYANALANAPQSLQSLQEVDAVKGDFAPNPILSEGPGGIGSDYASSQGNSPVTPSQIVADVIGQSEPFSEGSGGIGSDFASSQPTAPLSEGSGGIGSDFVSSNSQLSAGQGGIGSDFASSQPTAPLSEGQGGIGSDFSSSQPNTPLSSGEGGIGSDFASSQPTAPLSSGAGGIGSDFASSQATVPLSEGAGGIGSDFVSSNSQLSSGQGGIGSDFASSQGAIPASSEASPIAPVSPAEQPALVQNEGAYQFSQGFTGGTEPTSENSFGQQTPGAPDFENSSQLPSWMSDIITPFDSAGAIAANDYQAFANEFSSTNVANAPEMPLSSGAGGIGSDFASSQPSAPLSSGTGGIGSDFASSQPNSPSAPQTPQSPQTPTSPEQNPAIENPPLPNARPSTPSNPSIVDFLNSVGQDTSFATRAALAAANGIENYIGSAAQNLKLLQLCFAGTCFK